MKLATAFLAVGAVEAVSFSAWNGLSCRGAKVVTSKGTSPYRCYYIGSSASITAMGLGGNGNSEYKVYSDTKCKNLVGQVKYNNLCEDYNFLSVAFIPPAGATVQEEEISLPPYGSFDWRHRALTLARDGYPMDEYNVTAPVEATAKAPSEAPVKRVPVAFGRRNTGDRYLTEYGLSGIDEADDNNGNTADFLFTDSDQANRWGGTVLNRLRDQENRGAVVEYNGNQRVNGRELGIDLRPNSGTMNDIDDDDVTSCLALFLNHRVRNGHNRWQFYVNGRQLFELVFKAAA